MRDMCLAACLMAMLILSSCSSQDARFSFRQTEQGYELTEGDRQVFFYQQAPKTLTGEYVCNNYIHPLYSLDGDTLTEEFPPDHPYHRGVFLSWHQLFKGSANLGDGWVNAGISQEVLKVNTSVSGKSAELSAEVLWKSDSLAGTGPFMKENTVITVFPSANGIRVIDFRIGLTALVEELMLGGSDDPKGYGGFCIRLDIPDDMKFVSEGKNILPQELQVNAGNWMDFSGNFGNSEKINGVAILCSPQNPLFPSPWILRQKGSMQNAVWPGREKVKIDQDKQLVLRYRLVIHNGNTDSVDFAKLQADYSREQ